MRLAATAFILTLLACGQANAQDAQLGRLSWSAFHCASLASQANEPEEQERLFSLGYQSGLTFIEAVRAGHISDDDLRATVPVGFLMGMRGPTPDFMLGRIYEAAVGEAYDDVSEDSVNSLDAETRRFFATNLFQRNNCVLLR